MPSSQVGGVKLATNLREVSQCPVASSVEEIREDLIVVSLSETDYKFEKLVVDGGVARNEFILQMIANLTGK